MGRATPLSTYFACLFKTNVTHRLMKSFLYRNDQAETGQMAKASFGNASHVRSVMSGLAIRSRSRPGMRIQAVMLSNAHAEKFTRNS